MVRQHLVRHVRPRPQLVAESLPSRIEQNSSHSSHQLRRQHLGRIGRVGRIDPPRRMDLDLVHVDRPGAQRRGERDAVAGGKISGRGGEPHQFRTVLIQIGAGVPVRGESSRGEDDVGSGQPRRSAFLSSIVFHIHSHHSSVVVLDQPRHLRIDQNLRRPLLLVLPHGLLHPVDDLRADHPVLGPVRPLPAVPAQLRQKAQVDAHPFPQPDHRRRAVLDQRVDERKLRGLPRRLNGIVPEDLLGVVSVDALFGGTAPVDARRGLVGVTTEAVLLLHDYDAASSVEYVEGGGEARQAAPDHHGVGVILGYGQS
mmetsp:Transcript_45549/g.84372  ORF Transcript_45549/g.84372 Transcript_45549/m.84372 type:complete len:312 (-) Transcript_45549:684-1619(-)